MDIMQRIAARGIVTAALAVASVAAACFAGGCASSSSQGPAFGTATTTSGDPYAPGAVELYVARRQAQGACPQDLAANIDFPARTAEMPASELADVAKWAACLNRPELQHSTIVLVGGQPADADGLFLQRAQRVRAELVKAGVDARRIVIGSPNASRDGGLFVGANTVRVEMSSQASESMRAIAPRQRTIMQGVR